MNLDWRMTQNIIEITYWYALSLDIENYIRFIYLLKHLTKNRCFSSNLVTLSLDFPLVSGMKISAYSAQQMQPRLNTRRQPCKLIVRSIFIYAIFVLNPSVHMIIEEIVIVACLIWKRFKVNKLWQFIGRVASNWNLLLGEEHR